MTEKVSETSWLDRAEEAFEAAEMMKDSECKASLLTTGRLYMKLAERCRKQSGASKLKTPGLKLPDRPWVRGSTLPR